MAGRRSNPLMITLCCFITLLSSLAYVCFFVSPYAVCLLAGDDAGLSTAVWPPVLIVRTGADDTLMHNVTDDCCRVHPSAGGVVAVPTFVPTGAEPPHHLPAVNFNCSVPSASSARILHGTRTDSSPPPASDAVVVGNGKSRRLVTALRELINPDLALVTIIIIVLADLAVDERKKKKSGRMAPLLIMLLLAIAATGSAAADARGSGCSNDVNLRGKFPMCGPPSPTKPHN
uniref:Uncharacterized protein n=1 Tax=Oryza punctata TaxID=4537 RepID=A0A0E0M0G6_ORYPU